MGHQYYSGEVLDRGPILFRLDFRWGANMNSGRLLYRIYIYILFKWGIGCGSTII